MDNNKNITIEKDNVTISLAAGELEVIKSYMAKADHRNDVLFVVKDRVDDGELPAEALENEEYIEAVLDLYEDYLSECEWTWRECMEMALDEISYSEE